MIDLPPTICEQQKEHAAIVFHHVTNANVRALGKLYSNTPLDRDRKIIHKALDLQKGNAGITPTVFSVQIYKECLERKHHNK